MRTPLGRIEWELSDETEMSSKNGANNILLSTNLGAVKAEYASHTTLGVYRLRPMPVALAQPPLPVNAQVAQPAAAPAVPQVAAQPAAGPVAGLQAPQAAPVAQPLPVPTLAENQAVQQATAASQAELLALTTGQLAHPEEE